MILQAMRFGKKFASLCYEPWLPYYVDYKKMKKIVKAGGQDGSFNFKVNLMNALKDANAHYVEEVSQIHHSDAVAFMME